MRLRQQRFHAVLAGTLVTAIAIAQPQGADPLRFERADDLALEVHHVGSHSLTLDRLEVQRGEAEPKSESIALRLLSETDLTVADAPRAAGPGLRRDFVAGAGTLQIGLEDEEGKLVGPEVRLESRLVGLGVAFVPATGEPGGFARHYDTAAEGLESHLPRLESPTDWGRLLPAADSGVTGRARGDAWDLEPAALRGLLAPVGFALLKRAKTEDSAPLDPRLLRAFENGVGGNVQVAFDGDVTGVARAEVVELEETRQDGVVSVIEITFDLRARADRTRALSDVHAPAPGDSDSSVLSGHLEATYSGKAVVRWSPVLLRPVSIAVEASETIGFSIGLLDETDEVVIETLEFSGDLRTQTTLKDVVLGSSARGE